MHRFKSILFSPLGQRDNPAALRRIVDLTHRNDATLTLFSASEPPPKPNRLTRHRDVLEQLAAADHDAKRRRLTQLASRGGADFADLVVEPGNPALTLVVQVLAAGHDLVVVTTDDDCGDAATINRLLRKCPCPVWVIRPTRARKLRVLAAVDPDPDETELNLTILEIAASLARIHDGELHVGHAFEISTEHLLRSPLYGGYSEPEIERIRREERAERYADVLRLLIPSQDQGAHWKVHVVHGAPAEVIPDFVGRYRINLLVLGTVARTGLRGLLMGNTAERILTEVCCSVMAVKPPGFISPIARP